MLMHRLPYPPDRGDRIRSYHILRTLCRHFDVAVACTSEDPVWLQHHQLLATMARQVFILPVGRRWTRIRGLGAMFLGQAITPSCYYRVGLAEQVLQWHEQQPFDAVLTFCTGMIRFARLLTGEAGNGFRPRLNLPRPRHVIDLVDVDSVKWKQYAQGTWAPLRWVYGCEARRLRQVEAGRYDRFDAITVTTDAEAETYRRCVGEHPNLRVVTNGVDLEYFFPQPDTDAKTLVFVGVLNYRPNADGVSWFAHEVMPRLHQVEPQARFVIVGRHPTPRVLNLDGLHGTEVVGSVPDVRDYLRDASVVVAPLRMARGVQNKVLEAMASRRAVVSSPSAAKGIDAVDGRDFLVADHPEQWVEAIRDLFQDAERRRRVAAAARQRVEQRYNWSRCLQPMVDLLRGEYPQADAA